MSFGTKLAFFILGALLLEVIPLGLILRGTADALATGQLIGVFVAIAVLTCVAVGAATYRHFRNTKAAHVVRRAATAVFVIAMTFLYLFQIFHFIERTNHSAAGWSGMKIIDLLEQALFTPLLIYLAFRSVELDRNEPKDSA